MLSSISIPYTVLHFQAHKIIKELLLGEIESISLNPLRAYDHEIFKSDWANQHNISLKYQEILKPHLVESLSVVSKEFGFDKFTIHELWFQQYLQNNSHTWHNHSGCQFTCIYYLELSELAPPTQFINPIDKTIFQINVIEGDILIMPSVIVHQSPVVSTDCRKTIISFNMSFGFDNNAVGDYYGN